MFLFFSIYVLFIFVSFLSVLDDFVCHTRIQDMVAVQIQMQAVVEIQFRMGLYTARIPSRHRDEEDFLVQACFLEHSPHRVPVNLRTAIVNLTAKGYHVVHPLPIELATPIVILEVDAWYLQHDGPDIVFNQQVKHQAIVACVKVSRSVYTHIINPRHDDAIIRMLLYQRLQATVNIPGVFFRMVVEHLIINLLGNLTAMAAREAFYRTGSEPSGITAENGVALQRGMIFRPAVADDSHPQSVIVRMWTNIVNRKFLCDKKIFFCI